MAADERPPYPNGVGARGRAVDHDKLAPAASRRTASESDVTELAQSASAKDPPQLNIHSEPIPPGPTDATTSVSTASSTTPSREPSPTRPAQRAASATSASRIPSLPRKGSGDRSPVRSTSNALPSATSTQRTTPTNKSSVLSPPSTAEPANATDMPTRTPGRRQEPDATVPNTSSKRSSASPDDSAANGDRSAPRNVGRALNGSGPALETVEELASDPSTPSSDSILKDPPTDEPRPSKTELSKIDEDATPKAVKQTAVESGSESGGNKSSGGTDETERQSGASLSGGLGQKRSTTSLAGARGKAADASVRNMTVETETVRTVPQVPLGVGAGDRATSARSDQGTLRMKPSMETIRPKKDKKKTRKPAALAGGTASSKADIFEAKVASAVDEADVSDSDETFVYESNPPDPYPARQHRYHSRTPSATSMISQGDQFASRTRPGMRDGNHSVTGKRSMKFTNNTYNNVDGENGDDNGRYLRVDSGTHTPRHHHIGRYGRNSTLPSLFDGDSPFPQSQPQTKSPKHLTGGGFRQPKTRTLPNYRSINSSKKMGDVYGFDYDAEGADDERTPLVGSPRVTRSRHGHGRRPNSASLRQMEYMQQRQRGAFSRYGTCVFIGLLLLLIIGGATTFVVAITKPLIDVKVVAIQNVLASEQEIMLDLNVQASNPNLFPVAVDDMDVNIFARSRFVGTDSFWRNRDPVMNQVPKSRRASINQWLRCLGSMSCLEDTMSERPVHESDGVDHGTDPIGSDPAGDPQTMLLGRVFQFDSPLAFDPSPWNYQSSRSKGQIRLARPGNKTEEGGTERWERVLQHPFELIVRGVIKYQLSLTSRYFSASVSSSVRVVPQHDGDGDGDEDPPEKNETVKLYKPKLRPRRRHLTIAGGEPPIPSPTSAEMARRRPFTA